MKRLVTTVVMTLLAAFNSTAQDKKPAPSTDVQKTSPASRDTTSEQTKGEVDLLLEKLKEQGETILPVAGCLEKCKNSEELITSGVVPGRAVELPQPEYPALAGRAHAAGEVAVMLIVDDDGKVMAAQAVSGHPLLRAAALKAAREARFSPSLLNGKPVKVVGTIIYNFVD